MSRNKKNQRSFPKGTLARFFPTRQPVSVSRKTPGAAPGTITHIGRKRVDSIDIRIYDYNESRVSTAQTKSPDECLRYRDNGAVTWFRVTGLHDTETIKTLLDGFGIHPLIQEDVVNTGQRPKVEVYDRQVFMVLKAIRVTDEKIEYEQISIVLGKDFVFSFQESDYPVFSAIENRIQYENTRLRRKGSDYTAYALIDIVADYYFAALDEMSSQIDLIEDALLLNTDRDHLVNIHNLKRELSRFRKKVWPLRDSLNTLLRDDNELIRDETKLFIRDVYDHVIQVIDSLDNYREIVTSLHDMYMTNISNKMNEVMQVLTIIATIFIPLTFIAGVYGMNFEYMPELAWKWAYPATWSIMLLITGGMILYFKRKRWF